MTYQLNDEAINSRLIAIGVEMCWPLRNSLGEVLQQGYGSSVIKGSAVTFTAAGPDCSARANNDKAANFPGADANSWADLGSIGQLITRSAANGGWYLGFMVKITQATTAIRLGYRNTTTNHRVGIASNWSSNELTFLYYPNTVNAGVELQDPRVIIDGTNGKKVLNDETWHHLAISSNTATGVTSFYIDGELFSRLRSSSIAGLAIADLPSFFLGAQNQNGSAAYYHASAYCEVTAAARPLGQAAIMEIYRLSTTSHVSHERFDLTYGPRKDFVADRCLRTFNRGGTIVFMGDSTKSTSGPFHRVELYRQCSLAAGGRLANYLVPIADDGNGDTNSLPGAYLSIAAGATAKIYFNVLQESIEQNIVALGSDEEVRRGRLLDLSQGLRVDLTFRKQAAPTGTVTWNLKGSMVNLQEAGSPAAGTEYYLETLASATVSAATITGGTTEHVKSSVTSTTADRHNSYMLTVTNNGSTAVILELAEAISVANASAGVWVYIFARGGYTVSSITTNHPNAASFLRTLGPAGPNVFVLDYMLNDSGSQYPTAFASSFANTSDSICLAAAPDAVIIWSSAPHRAAGYSTAASTAAGVPVNALLYDNRADGYFGAMADYVDANPSKPIRLVNERKAFQEQGFTAYSESLFGRSEPVSFVFATTYSAGNTVYIPIHGSSGNRYHYEARATTASKHPFVDDQWAPIIRNIVDTAILSPGVHHTRETQIRKAQIQVAGMTATGSRSLVHAAGRWGGGLYR